MLTVFCVLWGDKYHPGYVYALQEAVARHLTVEHRFVCITKQKLIGIDTRLPWVTWHGWWQKIQLLCRHVSSGPSLYFDLDVVITGSLDYLVPYTEHRFAAPANWAQSGHGGIQSSVMAWNGQWHEPYEQVKRLWSDRIEDNGYTILGGKRFWGDQELLWDMLGDDWVRIPRIYSYKYHCRKNRPDDMSVCVFHGEPKPVDVTDPWISYFTATLRSHIKSNTDNGLPQASSATA